MLSWADTHTSHFAKIIHLLHVMFFNTPEHNRALSANINCTAIHNLYTYMEISTKVLIYIYIWDSTKHDFMVLHMQCKLIYIWNRKAFNAVVSTVSFYQKCFWYFIYSPSSVAVGNNEILSNLVSK